MNKIAPVIGFVFLAVLAFLVYGFAVYDAWTLQPVVGILLTLGFVGLLFTLFNESKGLATVKIDALFTQKNLFNFIAVVIGAVLSHWINVDLKQGLVIGSAVVGLAAAVLFPDYAAPAYTGSFVGMAGTTLLPAYSHIIFAGVVAGIFYILTLAVFGGFGGKLGAIAASGCVFVGICLSTEFTHPAVPKWDIGQWLVLYSIIAAVLTYYLSNMRKQSAVLASSAVGLTAGILLPAVHGDVGKTLAVMAICASFAGMSNTKRIPNLVAIAFVGLSAALVYMFANPFIGGTGGKLGTIAFSSGMAIRGLLDLIAKFQGSRKI
ncbi:MAG: hypothetical protein ACUVR2_00885 [Anaerolineae bacterium]